MLKTEESRSEMAFKRSTNIAQPGPGETREATNLASSAPNKGQLTPHEEDTWGRKLTTMTTMECEARVAQEVEKGYWREKLILERVSVPALESWLLFREIYYDLECHCVSELDLSVKGNLMRSRNELLKFVNGETMKNLQADKYHNSIVILAKNTPVMEDMSQGLTFLKEALPKQMSNMLEQIKGFREAHENWKIANKDIDKIVLARTYKGNLLLKLKKVYSRIKTNLEEYHETHTTIITSIQAVDQLIEKIIEQRLKNWNVMILEEFVFDELNAIKTDLSSILKALEEKKDLKHLAKDVFELAELEKEIKTPQPDDIAYVSDDNGPHEEMYKIQIAQFKQLLSKEQDNSKKPEYEFFIACYNIRSELRSKFAKQFEHIDFELAKLLYDLGTGLVQLDVAILCPVHKLLEEIKDKHGVDFTTNDAGTILTELFRLKTLKNRKVRLPEVQNANGILRGMYELCKAIHERKSESVRVKTLLGNIKSAIDHSEKYALYLRSHPISLLD